MSYTTGRFPLKTKLTRLDPFLPELPGQIVGLSQNEAKAPAPKGVPRPDKKTTFLGPADRASVSLGRCIPISYKRAFPTNGLYGIMLHIDTRRPIQHNSWIDPQKRKGST
jgi:hypothetical protein